MIKKYFIVCITALAITQFLYSIEEETNQTFMFTRPIYNTIGHHQASWSNHAYSKQYHGVAVQGSAIYGQSFENLTSPEYFLFGNKRSLIVAGGSAAPTNPATTVKAGSITTESFDRDILGQWVGINDETYCDSFSLKPSQRQAAAVLEYNQDIENVMSIPIFKNWYIAVSLPVTSVENNINFSGETITLNAFNSSRFQYVKFHNGPMNSTRLSNVRFMFGTKYISEQDILLVTGTGVTVPLVQQVNNYCLFEPIQGYNAHFAFNTHFITEFPIVKKDEAAISRICFHMAIDNTFLARNHQFRTFDIKKKPYSRYMKLLDRHTNSIVPAMNVLTLDSQVEPFNIFNLIFGLRFHFKDSVGEIGYELWAHGEERVIVDPVNQWNDDRYGIAFINENCQLAKIDGGGIVTALTPGELGQTASNSTINYVAVPDEDTSCCGGPTTVQKNKYLRLKDLDTKSAASQSAVTHRAYATIGFGNKGEKFDCFCNFALFIEAAQNNAALSMWGGWAKFGVSF